MIAMAKNASSSYVPEKMAIIQSGPLETGFPTLIIVILFGITNVSIGVMAESLVRTLQAARGRPVFIVDEAVEGSAN